MATPAEKLADSLEQLKTLQDKGIVAVKFDMLSRTHRERLVKNRFLQEVYKGWYLIIPPHATYGETTTWYSNYWSFCSQNLDDRFGDDWCLSPEQSIQLHAGNTTIPTQLIVRTDKGGPTINPFPHNTSLLIINAIMPDSKDREIINGIRVYKLPIALIASAEFMYKSNPVDMRTALSLIKNSSDVLEHLLEGGKSTIAGRLAGAFRNIGRDSVADDIIKTMSSADHNVREVDPFEIKTPQLGYQRPRSPYEARIKYMWQSMREIVLEVFPKAPGLPKQKEQYIKAVNDLFVTDAYHSLSIEKYTVTAELIDKVRNGTWDPLNDENDKNQRNAMAAKGYWEAFKKVLESLSLILDGNNSGSVVDNDHSAWYRELFSPSVSAGILKPMDLAGYRNKQVFIEGSLHTPLNNEAVRDAMPVLFDLLQSEPEASVRAVLGHFVFVFIHPYMDGNGRIGRFLLNSMLVSGGFPWTVIPVEQRKTYMNTLEEASVRGNIKPFAEFISRLVLHGMEGRPEATIASFG
jgi:hypothetical protein